ncbi:hypothetical protein KSP39_PZI000367 [Platanthera zijinensis]|uniref:Uncharacterized protein n=1 Tax=Platanthera zijinensis TaxID=2320716 RepID=A0AAP0C1A2_9ASPA
MSRLIQVLKLVLGVYIVQTSVQGGLSKACDSFATVDLFSFRCDAGTDLPSWCDSRYSHPATRNYLISPLLPIPEPIQQAVHCRLPLDPPLYIFSIGKLRVSSKLYRGIPVPSIAPVGALRTPHILASGSDDRTILICGPKRPSLKRKDTLSNGSIRPCNGTCK